MAFNTGSDSGRHRYMAEINVTPLVDVILVLLIIFMVTAPMMTKGLDVKLPRTTAKALPQRQKNIVITIDGKGNFFLNKIKVDETVLVRRLKGLKEAGRAKQVLLRADSSVPYGTVAKVVAAIRKAGIEELGLVTEPVTHRKKR